MAPGLSILTIPTSTPDFVVRVIGLALLVVDGAIFGFYATRNVSVTPYEGQRTVWRYLQGVGITATIIGITGLAERLTGSIVAVAFGDLALFLLIASIAFALREIYYNSALAPPPEKRQISLGTIRHIELALFGIIAIEWLAVVLIDRIAVVAIMKAVASVVLTTYGVWFNERLETMTGGSGFDTVRLHLLPILVITGLLGLVDAVTVLGGPTTIVDGIELSLLVLVGGLLLPATIRLQRNVAGR